MIFCRVECDDGMVYGEGLNPTAALENAESNSQFDFNTSDCDISFWEAVKLHKVLVKRELTVVYQR